MEKNTPKNILFINSTANLSGGEFSLLGLMAKLDQKKFSPILLLPEEGPFSQEARGSGIEVLVLPSFIKMGEHYRLRKLPQVITALRGLKKVILKKKIALVHCNSPRASYLGSLAARLAGIPAVTHVREIEQTPFANSLKGRFLGWSADVIIAVSEAVQRSVLEKNRFLHPKTKVIYNGLDPKEVKEAAVGLIREELKISAGVPLIGCVGRIDPGKGIENLIAAVGQVRDSCPEIKALVVGSIFFKKDQVYFRQLRQMARDAGLEDAMVFTGFRADVLAVMGALDIVVHPATYPDPLPRAVLEAMALKKPIVATRVGGIPEMLEDGVSGLLVEPGEPEALAAAILSLLNDSPKAQKLGRAARKKIEDAFLIEKHVAAVSSIYERLLQSRSDSTRKEP